jgi:hypothetical protein
MGPVLTPALTCGYSLPGIAMPGVESVHSRRGLLRAAAGFVAAEGCFGLVGCVPGYRSSWLESSLDPVNTGRPLIRYRPIQGRSRGPSGLLGALLDLRRLSGVDGYIGVSVEQHGDGNELETVVTAYPFTYGDDPRPISIRVGPEQFETPAAAARGNRPVATVQGSRAALYGRGASVRARLEVRRQRLVSAPAHPTSAPPALPPTAPGRTP